MTTSHVPPVNNPAPYGAGNHATGPVQGQPQAGVQRGPAVYQTGFDAPRARPATRANTKPTRPPLFPGTWAAQKVGRNVGWIAAGAAIASLVGVAVYFAPVWTPAVAAFFMGGPVGAVALGAIAVGLTIAACVYLSVVVFRAKARQRAHAQAMAQQNFAAGPQGPNWAGPRGPQPPQGPQSFVPPQQHPQQWARYPEVGAQQQGPAPLPQGQAQGAPQIGQQQQPQRPPQLAADQAAQLEAEQFASKPLNHVAPRPDVRQGPAEPGPLEQSAAPQVQDHAPPPVQTGREYAREELAEEAPDRHDVFVNPLVAPPVGGPYEDELAKVMATPVRR